MNPEPEETPAPDAEPNEQPPAFSRHQGYTAWLCDCRRKEAPKNGPRDRYGRPR